MKAVVALALSVSLLGCFPNNARHRTYAKYAEGGALVTGIALSAFSNTGADCDMMSKAGVDTNCRTKATWISTAGVTLILVGLLGFVATVSTAEDDAESTPRILSETKGSETKDVKLPPGVDPKAGQPAAGAGSDAGSDAAPTPSDAGSGAGSGAGSATPATP